jgi:predicted acyl esterase
MSRLALHLSIICLVISSSIAASHIESFEISARDGVKLYTTIFFPWAKIDIFKKSVPAVFITTPYGADANTDGKMFENTGKFVVAVQDDRGRFKSKGNFSMWQDASIDGYDTIKWLISQKWSNGKVFSYGISSSAISEYMYPISNQSNLYGQSMALGSAQVYKTAFNNGAYRKELIDGWLTAIKEDKLIPFIKSHEAYDDIWAKTDVSNSWYNVHYPSVHAAGWYDIFLQQSIDAFEAYRSKCNPSARNQAYLIVDPFGHCSGGQTYMPNNRTSYSFEFTIKLFSTLSSEVSPQKIQKFLDDSPHIIFYVIGPDARIPKVVGNFWVAYDDWPEVTNFPLYLHRDRTLQPTPQTEPNSFTDYVYDPAKPVPTIGGNTLVYQTCGPYDQSSIEHLPDTVVFTSEDLLDHLAITGTITADLYVSSSALDTDFTVKVSDVYPDGRSILVQDGIIRMKWRNSKTNPSPLTPNLIYSIQIDLFKISYVFNQNHKIRVVISSSNSPRFNANPNNGLRLDMDKPIVIAKNRLYHDANHPSSITLPFVQLSDLQSHIFNPPQKPYIYY